MPGAGYTHGARARKVRGALTTDSAEATRHSLRSGFNGFLPVNQLVCHRHRRDA